MSAVESYIDSLPICKIDKEALRTIINSGKRNLPKEHLIKALDCTERQVESYMMHLSECGVARTEYYSGKEFVKITDTRLLGHLEVLHGERAIVN